MLIVKPASPAIAWMTCAARKTSGSVGTIRLTVGFGAPADMSSCFAFATSRFGVGIPLT